MATPDWQATCHAFTFRGGTTVTGITTITVTTINDDSSTPTYRAVPYGAYPIPYLKGHTGAGPSKNE